MRGGKIFIIIGVILGLATMVAALIIISSMSAPGPSTTIPTPSVPKTEKVVVAVQNIGEGDTVVPQMVEPREVALDEIPVGALRTVNLALGRMSKRDIFQGQVIEENMLISEEEENLVNPSIFIPKGKVAIALPIGKLSSVAYSIQKDDAVDLLITMPFIDVDEQSQTKLPLILSGEDCPGCVPANPQIPRMTTQLLVQDAIVLRVGPYGVAPTPMPAEGEGQAQPEAEATPQAAPEPPDIVVLMVNHQDALVIKYARESGAVFDLILRSSGDHDIVTTEPVTLDYMLARFGIVVPPKRPYTLFSFTSEGRQAVQAASGEQIQPR